MKRSLVVALAVMLAVALPAFSGCGGDTAKAREYMEEADAAQAELDSQLNALSSDTTALVTSALQGNTSAVTQEDLSKIAGMTGTYKPELARVRDLYARITKLGGVDDYVEYAKAMMKALDLDAAVVEAAGGFLAGLEPYLKSGDVAGLSKKIETSTDQIVEIQDLQTEVDEAYAAAETIKKEKNLGQ